MKLIRILLLGAATCVVSLSVAAQWQWVDNSGRKVFSDRPPPPEIPEKNILRQGGKRSPGQAGITSQAPAAGSVSTNGTAAATSSPPTEAGTPKPSGVDKGLADKKRQAAEAEVAKRKAEEEKVAQARAENCERAKRAKAGLESGTRQFRVNDQGEREVLDESARAAESQRVQSVIESDCR